MINCLLLICSNTAFLILGGSLVACGCKNLSVNKRIVLACIGYVCAIVGTMCLVTLISALKVKP